MVALGVVYVTYYAAHVTCLASAGNKSIMGVLRTFFIDNEVIDVCIVEYALS